MKGLRTILLRAAEDVNLRQIGEAELVQVDLGAESNKANKGVIEEETDGAVHGNDGHRVAASRKGATVTQPRMMPKWSLPATSRKRPRRRGRILTPRRSERLPEKTRSERADLGRSGPSSPKELPSMASFSLLAGKSEGYMGEGSLRQRQPAFFWRRVPGGGLDGVGGVLLHLGQEVAHDLAAVILGDKEEPEIVGCQSGLCRGHGGT